jgi:hypothetical protein
MLNRPLLAEVATLLIINMTTGFNGGRPSLVFNLMDATSNSADGAA